MCGNICRSTGLVPTWCRYTFTMCPTILFSDVHCDICRSTNLAQCSAVTRLGHSWKKRKKKHRQKLTQRNSTEAIIRNLPQNSVKYHYKACLTTPSAYRVSIHPSYMSIFTAKCKTKQFLRIHWQKIAQKGEKQHRRFFPTMDSVLRLFSGWAGAGPRQAWQLQHWAKIDLWHNVATGGIPPNNQRLIPIHIHNSQLSLP